MATTSKAEKNLKPPKSIEIEIDGETVQVSDKETTPAELLALVGMSPTDHYLVEQRGKREQINYQGRENEPIKIHAKEAFLTLPTGPATVS